MWSPGTFKQLVYRSKLRVYLAARPTLGGLVQLAIFCAKLFWLLWQWLAGPHSP